MTVTYVGAGAAATGNNTSVTPGAITGIAVGDMVVIEASIQTASTATVNTPDGWTALVVSGGVVLLGRVWATGDAMPLISFTGGAAGSDTIARAVAFRGVGADALTQSSIAAQSNATAVSVAYPALDVPGPGHAVVLGVWRADDAGTSPTSPSGFTLVGLTAATAGNDASQILYYRIETTEADVTAGTITLTGSVTAVSRVVGVALKPAAAIAVQELDLFPPRTQITVTGLTSGDDVVVYRSVAGQRTALRAGAGVNVTDPSFLVVDGELPFGVPVSYVAVVNDTAEYSTTATTYSLPGGKAVISDAVTGLSSEVTILAWDEKAYDKGADVFKVGGRNVVVSGQLGQFTATIELYFDTYSATANFLALMTNATQGAMQLRGPSPTTYPGVDSYLAVLTARERRYSQDGSDGRRTWVLDVAETEAWASELEAVGFTYADVVAYYAPAGTYATAVAEFATYLAAEQADYSA
jgi:hypothetical protein